MDTEPVGKTQAIRMVDVLLIGPVMMRAAWELRASSPTIAVLLGVSGAATVIYNWRNYLAQEQRIAAQVRQMPSELNSARVIAALRQDLDSL